MNNIESIESQSDSDDEAAAVDIAALEDDETTK